MEKSRSLPRSAGRLAAGGSLLLGGVGTALFLAPQAGATGQTFTVTNTNNAGGGSLRQAISDADSNPGHDVIEFASGVSGTINLLTRLAAHSGMDIRGPDQIYSRSLVRTAPKSFTSMTELTRQRALQFRASRLQMRTAHLRSSIGTST